MPFETVFVYIFWGSISCKEGLVQDEVTKKCREKARSTGDNNDDLNLGPVVAS